MRLPLPPFISTLAIVRLRTSVVVVTSRLGTLSHWLALVPTIIKAMPLLVGNLSVLTNPCGSPRRPRSACGVVSTTHSMSAIPRHCSTNSLLVEKSPSPLCRWSKMTSRTKFSVSNSNGTLNALRGIFLAYNIVYFCVLVWQG